MSVIGPNDRNGLQEPQRVRKNAADAIIDEDFSDLDDLIPRHPAAEGEKQDPEEAPPPKQEQKYEGVEKEMADVVKRATKLAQQGEVGEANDTVRHFIRSMSQNKVVNRAIKKNLEGIRTQFFYKYARHYSVRYSALLYVVAVKTWANYTLDGLRGEKSGFVASTERWGKWIGCSRHNIFYLVKKAKKNGHLNFDRRMRGLKVWISNRSLWAELNRARKHKLEGREPLLGYYNLRLARVLGVNGSIVVCLLRKVGANGEDRAVMGATLERWFPWMTANAWRKELEKLFNAGAIHRTKYDFVQREGRCGYQYFLAKRTSEDHRKWASFTKASE
jgi:hypothetical protein